MKESEDANKHKNFKTIFRDLKEFSIEQIINTPLFKDNNGNILTENKEVLGILKQYFGGLLNKELNKIQKNMRKKETMKK
jgi:hypothetical protein